MKRNRIAVVFCSFPPLELETEEEKAAFEVARKRHELYHQRKKQREAKKVE